jgi:23S rRNA pseudouridine1911/1915/1917 synthase
MTPTILYEDEDLVIVDKPAGVVVHPTYKNPRGTLLDALPAGSRIAGRLDRPTSGLVVVAKTADAHARLQRTLASPDSEKRYLALVHGVTDAVGTIELPLASDPADRRRRIAAIAGAPSTTDFERIDTGALDGAAVSLLRCGLLTGRRHQIRVHLAARGWPIVGDATYGTPLAGFPRIALHAWRLTFVHPRTGDRLIVECAPPRELDELLSRCGVVASQSGDGCAWTTAVS